MSKDLPATGVVGAELPPGAPHEVSQPLQPEAGGIVPAPGKGGYESPRDRAARNERELLPLTYGKGPVQGGVAEAVVAAAEGKLDPFFERMKADKGRPPAAADIPIRTSPMPTTIKRIKREARVGVPERPVVPDPMAPTDLNIHGTPNDGMSTADTVPYRGQPRDPTAPIDLTHAPAASNTDSPSRGIPRQVVDPGKQPTGGFGDQAAMQYFALNGQELRVLVEALMDDIYKRIQDDLRFNEALTYPQVNVRVAVEVTGFVHDADFVVDRILAPTHEARTRTPLEVARAVADEMAFVILAEHQEADAASGEPLNSPDQTRLDLGLARPAKRIIKSGGVDVFVDVAG